MLIAEAFEDVLAGAPSLGCKILERPRSEVARYCRRHGAVPTFGNAQLGSRRPLLSYAIGVHELCAERQARQGHILVASFAKIVSRSTMSIDVCVDVAGQSLFHVDPSH